MIGQQQRLQKVVLIQILVSSRRGLLMRWMPCCGKPLLLVVNNCMCCRLVHKEQATDFLQIRWINIWLLHRAMLFLHCIEKLKLNSLNSNLRRVRTSNDFGRVSSFSWSQKDKGHSMQINLSLSRKEDTQFAIIVPWQRCCLIWLHWLRM